MTTIALTLTAGFAGLVVLGVPFVIAILGVTALALVFGSIEPAFLAQQVIAGSQSFSLLAIPLFTFAGYVLSESRAAARLVRLSAALIAWHMSSVSAWIALGRLSERTPAAPSRLIRTSSVIAAAGPGPRPCA